MWPTDWDRFPLARSSAELRTIANAGDQLDWISHEEERSTGTIDRRDSGRESRGSRMTRPASPSADSRALIGHICRLAGRGPLVSVLICDDRPEVRRNLADMLRPLAELVSITGVSDGFALVDAHQAEPADLVLIGFHDLGGGAELAMSLILGMDPSVFIIMVGAVDDAELLVNAYARGARGLLLWDSEPPATRP
jgi:CheY-like chemotaxis protein